MYGAAKYVKTALLISPYELERTLVVAQLSDLRAP
jgi:hypothetical protein